MKNIFTLILLTLPLLGISQIDFDKLEKRYGIFYIIGEKTPFTGTAFTYYDSGKKQSATEYKVGLLTGKIEAWYESGAKQAEGELKNGKREGSWTAWYENGQKVREGAFNYDKEEGKYIWWFENGNTQKTGVYHEGIPDGKWEWYFENGQKMQEGILRGEINDGTWKDWYENGNQKMIGTFKNGLKDGEWTWWDTIGNITTHKVYVEGLQTEGIDDLADYTGIIEYYLTKKDFKAALLNAEKALETIEDQSEDNKIYMGFVFYYSKVYSLFQHIDEAERVLLKSIGLSDKRISIIVNSIDTTTNKDLKKLAKKIEKHSKTKSKTQVGPHITLSLLYNILGDTTRLKKEQQLMMEISEMSDWVIKISMELYRLRAIKENGYGNISLLNDEISQDGETRDNQLALSLYLVQIGQFMEAEKITDKYLNLDENDIAFLFVQTNIEMGYGNVAEMKEYESQILKIDPKAFEK